MLIDADGLNAHAGDIEALKERPGPTVITPHAGELGRLLDVESDEVNAHRLKLARDAAERAGVVVVLKGDVLLQDLGAANLPRLLHVDVVLRLRAAEDGARERV